MSGALKARLRNARYALPQLVERVIPGQAAREAAAACARLERRGIATTVGYFGAANAPASAAAAATEELAFALASRESDTLLALKAPALGFDEALLGRLVAAGVPLAFDALAEAHAEATVALAERFGAGLALPARWRRSAADAARLREGPFRLRLVKGEWADPGGDAPDVEAAYLGLARQLAGRRAVVAVATHDPALADSSLEILQSAGTPCELERLRGLPRQRTSAVARQRGVPVRLYYPFGPGWWPYAVDKALARPHLPLWALRDWLGV